MKLHNKYLFDHAIEVVKSSNDATSGDGSEEQVHTYPVPDEETRTRGREGPRTSASKAFSARDISVCEGVLDHPP